MDGLIETPAISRAKLTDEAWTAIERRNWDVALARWAMMREAFPEIPDGHIWPAHTLWLAGRVDDAEAMAAVALQKFPGNPDALALHAQLAVTRENWREAARRWRRAATAAPERADVTAGLAAALRLSGELDAAEIIVAEGLVRHPSDKELLIENVWIAISREEWTKAAARAKAARARLTELGADSIHLGGAEHRIALHQHHEQIEETDSHSAEPPSADDRPAIETLMLSFESLGRRCDLGLVQRHFGVEPFGLLRLTFVPYDGLVAALQSRFEGIGGADTEFEIRDGELVAKVDRYGFAFHTFIGENELTPSGTHQRFYKRWLRHLTGQLIADLTAGSKFFVYASSEGVSEPEMLRLFELLRQYGPNRLLCVTPATDSHPDGEVERIAEDGLYAGYLERFAEFEAGEQPSFDSWRLICERVHDASNQPVEYVMPTADWVVPVRQTADPVDARAAS